MATELYFEDLTPGRVFDLGTTVVGLFGTRA
jgi:hypothetical protein